MEKDRYAADAGEETAGGKNVVSERALEEAGRGAIGDEPTPAPKGRRSRKASAAMFAAKTGMLAALSFGLSFLEFALFPAAGFLKLDFSSVISLIGGFAMGPAAGVTICLVKELLCLTKSSTGGVGEIANFIVTSALLLPPTALYRFRRKFSAAAIGLAIGCVVEMGAALLANRFVNFPLYMGAGAGAAFASLWKYVLAFNAIKCASVSAVTLLAYKRTARLLSRL